MTTAFDDENDYLLPMLRMKERVSITIINKDNHSCKNGGNMSQANHSPIKKLIDGEDENVISQPNLVI